MKQFIPDEYIPHYKYCMFLHDRLAEVIYIGEQYRLFDVKISINQDSQNLMELKQNGNSLEWLQKNGYKKELNEIIVKQVFVALLSDFCHYIFEALNNSYKGKLSVSFTLLRKPLKEDLFVFEQLLLNKEKFNEEFSIDEQYIDLANDKIRPEDKKDIIRKVIMKLEIQNLINEEFIYDIRYNKQKDYSFEPIWQKATHLITTCKHFMTEKGNLNFIFSNNEDKNQQIVFMYYFLPILMYYVYKLVMKIAVDDIKIENIPERGTKLRIDLGLKKTMKKYDINLGNLLVNKCDKCNKEIDFDDYRMTEIINKKIICKNCKNIIAR
jgi:hypothetical protein